MLLLGPGMNRSIKLSEETKLSLSVVVFWPKSHIFEINEKKCNFGPDGAACIASVLHFKRRKTQVTRFVLPYRHLNT